MRNCTNIFCFTLACCFLFLVPIQIVSAQNIKNAKEAKKTSAAKDSLDRTRKLILMGKYMGSSVILRWAPKTAAVWEKANITGCQLYRFEINEKNNDPFSHETQLTSAPL